MKNNFYLTKLLFIVTLIFGIVIPFQTFATYPATPYAAGETLAPTCAPGTTNCTVLLSGTGIASLNGLTGLTRSRIFL